MKRIIFMGTPAFSVPILEELINSKYEVVAVVTQPDRPVGRKKVLTPSPIKEVAVKHNIPLFQPEKISGSKEMEELLALKADLIVTAAYGQFLPTKLIHAPAYRSINVHASLLPKYRGGAPVHYAIIEGEKETGISIIYMEKKMDAGDILSQEKIRIENHDDVGTMFDKLSLLGRDLLMRTLPDVFEGNVTSTAQEESKVTFSPNIKREEERIDWNQSAEQIANKIRGMRPWPVAHALLNGERCKIWEAEKVDDETSLEPGSLIEWDKDSLYLACGSQSILKVTELQPAGKKKMSAASFINGVDIHSIQRIGFE